METTTNDLRQRRDKTIGPALFIGLCGVAAMLAAIVIYWSASGRVVADNSQWPLEALAALPVTYPKLSGQELFTREWQPHDPRSRSGDGLGPMFNDSSCVACHNQGGVGGGGAKAKNVTILTPMGGGTPNGSPPHPFAPSFVLHNFSTDEGFETWRRTKHPQFAPIAGALTGGQFTSRSQRQTPALFGAGLIDAIPESVLRELAQVHNKDFPEVSGRLAVTESGLVGRFGWKAQLARLDEFVITACAVELGLQVPGKEQPPLPHRKDYNAPGVDMNQAECDELVQFVRELPRPQQQRPGYAKGEKYLDEGEALFASVGCATCHVPKVGDVDGIFSDLLLHDMGNQLSDVGSSYGVFRHSDPPPSQQPPVEVAADTPTKTQAAVAAPTEWRTPPLWGVRDSAPYLHDGRADTLAAAVAIHDGEAKTSRNRFQALKFEEQQKVIAFLRSLASPMR